MRTKAQWKQFIEGSLPPEEKYIARNRAITGHYARWYLERPQLFKWAGMAAFASDQVGIGLALAELLAAPDVLVTPAPPTHARGLFELGLSLHTMAFNLLFALPVALHDMATRQLLRNDLDLIKKQNDAIFNDMAWAHVAYKEEGLAAIKAAASDDEHEYIFEGFRMIDEGARLIAEPARLEEGKELIFKGNAHLLKREQLTILQPGMDQLSNLGRMIVSVGGMLDFEGRGIYGAGAMSSFGTYAGALAVLSGQKCLTRYEDRWQWIEQDALPAWHKADAAFAEDTPIHRRLMALANQEPTMLQQTSALMNLLYPAFCLKLDVGQPALTAE